MGAFFLFYLKVEFLRNIQSQVCHSIFCKTANFKQLKRPQTCFLIAHILDTHARTHTYIHAHAAHAYTQTRANARSSAHPRTSLIFARHNVSDTGHSIFCKNSQLQAIKTPPNLFSYCTYTGTTTNLKQQQPQIWSSSSSDQKNCIKQQ